MIIRDSQKFFCDFFSIKVPAVSPSWMAFKFPLITVVLLGNGHQWLWHFWDCRCPRSARDKVLKTFWPWGKKRLYFLAPDFTKCFPEIQEAKSNRGRRHVLALKNPDGQLIPADRVFVPMNDNWVDSCIGLLIRSGRLSCFVCDCMDRKCKHGSQGSMLCDSPHTMNRT